MKGERIMTIEITRQDGNKILIDSEFFSPSIEQVVGVGSSMPDCLFLLDVGGSTDVKERIQYVGIYSAKEDAEAALQRILDEGDGCDLSEGIGEYGHSANDYLEMTDKDYDFKKAVDVRGLTALQYLNKEF